MECYRWGLVQWFHSKIKKNNSEKSIILCVSFQRRTLFNFLLCFSYIIKYSHKASFYQNIVKAQWQRSPIAKRKNRLNNKITCSWFKKIKKNCTATFKGIKSWKWYYVSNILYAYRDKRKILQTLHVFQTILKMQWPPGLSFQTFLSY